MLSLLVTAAAFVGPAARAPTRSGEITMRKPGQIGPDNLQGKFITGSYLKGYTVGSRAPPGAVSSGTIRGSAEDRARRGVNYNVFAENDANQFRCAAVPARQLSRGPANLRRAILPTAPPARPPTPAHARPRPPTPARPRPPARSRRYPRFGDLQGTKGNAERSAAIPGASQFIFGYLALLTELSRVCEGAPPNVVLHNFDVTPLTILGIASPLNL